MANVETPFYNEAFYRAQKDGSYRAAEVIVPIVLQYIQPRVVIDVGCGVAPWLAVWQKFGAQVLGVDGDYVDRKMLYINESNFQAMDLEQRIINHGQKFDLAMTLEVAEHLTPARADTFVEDLTKLSDVILFSAAISFQGGVNHINEQMQSYWAEKFSRHGFVCIDCIRPKIWNNDLVAVWYRQNILLYVNADSLQNYPELKIFYLEHISPPSDKFNKMIFLKKTSRRQKCRRLFDYRK